MRPRRFSVLAPKSPTAPAGQAKPATDALELLSESVNLTLQIGWDVLSLRLLLHDLEARPRLIDLVCEVIGLPLHLVHRKRGVVPGAAIRLRDLNRRVTGDSY